MRRKKDNLSLKKIVKKVGNVVKDSVKLAVEPVKAVAKVAGANVKETKYDTKLGQKVSDVTHDINQLGARPIYQTIGSITGETKPVELKTKVAKAIDKVQSTGLEVGHAAGKGFADIVTGGLATKAANVIRKDANKEQPFQYNELKRLTDSGIVPGDDGKNPAEQYLDEIVNNAPENDRLERLITGDERGVHEAPQYSSQVYSAAPIVQKTAGFGNIALILVLGLLILGSVSGQSK